ncbi:MAG TPA: hypothetical protein VNR64_21815, partial [Vicinamibacterales bacterium]|nr:hypothetical protein [Vicinamibacterales bacterium]
MLQNFRRPVQNGRVVRVFALALALSCAAAAALAADAAAPRIAIGDEPPGAALRVLDTTGTVPFPIAVRVAAPDFPADSGLDARLAALEARHIPVWVTIDAPAGEPDIDAWRSAVKALVDSHGTTLHMLEVAVDAQPPRVAAFAVQVAATEVRTARDTIQVALGGRAMSERGRREEIYGADLAP